MPGLYPDILNLWGISICIFSLMLHRCFLHTFKFEKYWFGGWLEIKLECELSGYGRSWMSVLGFSGNEESLNIFWAGEWSCGSGNFTNIKNRFNLFSLAEPTLSQGLYCVLCMCHIASSSENLRGCKYCCFLVKQWGLINGKMEIQTDYSGLAGSITH